MGKKFGVVLAVFLGLSAIVLVLLLMAWGPSAPGHLETVAVTGASNGTIVTLKWVGRDAVLSVTDYGTTWTLEWVERVYNGKTFNVTITESLQRPSPAVGGYCWIHYDHMLAFVYRDGNVTTHREYP